MPARPTAIPAPGSSPGVAATLLLSLLALALALPLAVAAAPAPAAEPWPDAGTPHPSPSRASYHRARALVESALAAFGLPATPPPLDLAVVSEGTLDRAARYQGHHPDRPAPGRYERTVAVTADGRAGWEFVFDRFDGALEGTRFATTAEGRTRVVGLVEPFAVEVVDPVLEASAVRVRRALPPALLADALESAAALRWLGTAEVAGREVERVHAALPDGEAVTLHFAPGDGRLVGWEMLADVPLWGDATVRWELKEYLPVDAAPVPVPVPVPESAAPSEDGSSRAAPGREGQPRPGAGTGTGTDTDTGTGTNRRAPSAYPAGHRVYLEDRLLLDVDHRRITAGAAADASPFALPADLEVQRPPAPEPGPPPPPRLDELAPGVHRIRGLRPGFAHLAVELEHAGEHGLLVVDAPAGWLELATEVPSSNFVPGATSSSVSERLLDLLAERFPDLPVRWLALTHFHSDHAGGVRAFVAAGATVLGAGPTRTVVERALARPHTLAADRYAAAPVPLAYEEVEGRRVLGEGGRTVELIEVAPNPHAAGMLVVHLPAADLLYVSDLLYTTPLEGFPGPGEAALASFFVGWLDGRGLAPGRILGAHGGTVAGPEHLEKVRRTGGAP